ncbi:hypothetical protein A5881_003936 [Enterococcus termitis]|nr:hypothetical protein A5881_003796 [Enterococcus termitis]
MDQTTGSKAVIIELLRGSREQQEVERYAYYNRLVNIESTIDFKEEEAVQHFYDYVNDNYTELISDEDQLKAIAAENKLVYINERGLELISLLKEYNPALYAQLGREKKLIKWAWERSELTKQRYTEWQGIEGIDSVEEGYLGELAGTVKSDYYFCESRADRYYLTNEPRLFETQQDLLFHEYVAGNLVTLDELAEMVQAYAVENVAADRMSPELKEWAISNEANRKWLVENKETIFLFDENVLNFANELDAMEDIIGE